MIDASSKIGSMNSNEPQTNANLDGRSPRCQIIQGELRRCARCREFKPLNNFYENAAMNGRKGSYCKPCAALYRIEWQAKHPGYNQKYWKKHYSEHRTERLIKFREHRQKNVQPYKARELFNTALAAGKVPGQPLLCNGCWDINKVGERYEAHHPSYAPGDELKVVWLCKSCHRRVHRNGLGERFK